MLQGQLKSAQVQFARGSAIKQHISSFLQEEINDIIIIVSAIPSGCC
jgi:hypothetical protein